MTARSSAFERLVRITTGLRQTLQATAACAFGMVPLGVAFGVLVVQLGLPWWWAPVFSGLIYAGSLEFLLVAASVRSASLATIALTTLLVNGRHIFYSQSFPLHRVRGRLAKLYSMFALIDEAYALTATPEAQRLSQRQLLATQAALQSYWVGGGLLGVSVASPFAARLPNLSFVLTALFTVLAIEAIRSQRQALTPLVACTCAAVAWIVAPDEFLLVAMGCFAALLTASTYLRDLEAARVPS